MIDQHCMREATTTDGTRQMKIRAQLYHSLEYVTVAVVVCGFHFVERRQKKKKKYLRIVRRTKPN